MMATTTDVYTDGACRGNPGPGGWGWVVPDGPWASGPERRSTNQRMEVRAVLDALSSLEGPLTVFSDSTYVVNCFRDRWHEGWVRRGWGELQTQARSQPRLLGAADRAVPAKADRDRVPVGARPLREPLERDSRPASHRGRRLSTSVALGRCSVRAATVLSLDPPRHPVHLAHRPMNLDG